jgi:hypothetical protein
MPIIEGARSRFPALAGSAAPTVNVTGLGVLAVGDTYMATSTGNVYVVTATNKTSTITFVLIGGQV